MEYAFDEIQNLVGRISSTISNKDPVVRYICALVAELAYHHVPQYEIDEKKRAKIIPCKGYREIIASGNVTSVTGYIESLDFNRSFVVIDRGIIAVGIELSDCVFIGLRGTKFLFDWKINVKANLVKIDTNPMFHDRFILERCCNGRYHRGFSEESFRITLKIRDAIRDMGFKDISHIFLSGHSLGGAVAAISGNILGIAPTSTCIFGSPRYCDVSAYFSLLGEPPAQIRRGGDVIPFTPPRKLGYADHPCEFGTKGEPVFDQGKEKSLPFLLGKWGEFILKRVEPHDISSYRTELGEACNASGAKLPLVSYEKIKKSHIR